MMRQFLAAGIIWVVCLAQISEAQELLANGDFETLAVEGDPPTPTRDTFGNAVPVDWFRATGEASPGPPPEPLTELIGPENGDPADDSDGVGQYSVAMNPPPLGPVAPHSDWRSAAFETMPGEELFWSFDFKFTYVDPGFAVPEGFRIELRSFEEGAVGGSTSGQFVGEQTVYVYVRGFGQDGMSGGYASGGSYPHTEEQLTLANFNDGAWHTLSSDDFGDQDIGDGNDLWFIPSGGNFTDVRASINAGFIPLFSDQSQVRLDNISVVRPIEGIPGDYNENGSVDAADYVVWRNLLGTAAQLPNEDPNVTPGMVTQQDYNTWRANFGSSSVPLGASLTAATAPEPAIWAMLIAVAALFPVRRVIR